MVRGRAPATNAFLCIHIVEPRERVSWFQYHSTSSDQNLQTEANVVVYGYTRLPSTLQLFKSFAGGGAAVYHPKHRLVTALSQQTTERSSNKNVFQLMADVTIHKHAF